MEDKNFRLVDLWPTIRDRRENATSHTSTQNTVQTTMEKFCEPPSRSQDRVPTSNSILPASQGQVSSRRSIMPHDIGRQWSAVHHMEPPNRGATSTSMRLLEGDTNEMSSGRMLTRARGTTLSSVFRDPQSSAATTVCNTEARRGALLSSDSDDFTTPIPVRRRNTVCGMINRPDTYESVATGRWSTPAPLNQHWHRGMSAGTLNSECIGAASQNENEKPSATVDGKLMIEITPPATGNHVPSKGLASDEPVNRKRGWSILNSEENTSKVRELILTDCREQLRTKRLKVTDAGGL